MPPARKSAIWKYFTLVDKDTAQCSVCKRNYSRKGRTSTPLKNHLKVKHPEVYTCFLNGEDNATTSFKEDPEDKKNVGDEEEEEVTYEYVVENQCSSSSEDEEPEKKTCSTRAASDIRNYRKRPGIDDKLQVESENATGKTKVKNLIEQLTTEKLEVTLLQKKLIKRELEEKTLKLLLVQKELQHKDMILEQEKKEIKYKNHMNDLQKEEMLLKIELLKANLLEIKKRNPDLNGL